MKDVVNWRNAKGEHGNYLQDANTGPTLYIRTGDVYSIAVYNRLVRQQQKQRLSEKKTYTLSTRGSPRSYQLTGISFL